MTDSLKSILKLSVEERVNAIEAIWNSIEGDALPVTDEELTVARERYEEYIKNPSDSIRWEEARKKLMAKYGF
jgi:putative addiction module component (TIGR02574 family)